MNFFIHCVILDYEYIVYISHSTALLQNVETFLVSEELLIVYVKYVLISRNGYHVIKTN